MHSGTKRLTFSPIDSNWTPISGSPCLLSSLSASRVSGVGSTRPSFSPAAGGRQPGCPHAAAPSPEPNHLLSWERGKGGASDERELVKASTLGDGWPVPPLRKPWGSLRDASSERPSTRGRI